MQVEQFDSWNYFYKAVKQTHDSTLRVVFKNEPNRARSRTARAAGITFDFSRQFVGDSDVLAYRQLFIDRNIAGSMHAMFTGAPINVTEGRAVTHTRARRGPRESLQTAFHVADAIRSGDVKSATGAKFDHIVNIGIGGSDLGPQLVTRALADFCDGPRVSFVSNVDPSDLDDVLATSNPATTMFIVSSKTMSTIETMTNASRARAWVANAVGSDAAVMHFGAVTAHPENAREWGIHPDHILTFDESIGGRFSVSSSIGFPAMVAIGSARFQEFLDGMCEMDEHFRTAPIEFNVPILHASTVLANATALKFRSQAIVPYSHRLEMFPAYLSQVVMESNGKSTATDGSAVSSTSPVVWGAVGTDGQHAFFQLLHQGTDVIPVDFIVVNEPHNAGADGARDEAHRILVANAKAQADVLAFGRTLDETIAAGISPDDAPHRVFPGNRPSSTISLASLTPHSLGALMALYEHSVAVQGWLWGINSFDQFGVELGKSVALEMLATNPDTPPAR